RASRPLHLAGVFVEEVAVVGAYNLPSDLSHLIYLTAKLLAQLLLQEVLVNKQTEARNKLSGRHQLISSATVSTNPSSSICATKPRRSCSHCASVTSYSCRRASRTP